MLIKFSTGTPKDLILASHRVSNIRTVQSLATSKLFPYFWCRYLRTDVQETWVVIVMAAFNVLSLTRRWAFFVFQYSFQLCSWSVSICIVLTFLRWPTNAHLRKFYLLHRHVSASLVTIFRVSYSMDTSNTLVITWNEWEKSSKIRVNWSYRVPECKISYSLKPYLTLCMLNCPSEMFIVIHPPKQWYFTIGCSVKPVDTNFGRYFSRILCNHYSVRLLVSLAYETLKMVTRVTETCRCNSK